MLKKMSVFSDEAYALLRIVAGLCFAFHGWQKAQNLYANGFSALPPQIVLGAAIELVGGLLIASGIKTRPAAFLCSGTMAVAYIQFHWKLALGSNFFPAVNKGELALLYCFLFLHMACRGGVRWALGKD